MKTRFSLHPTLGFALALLAGAALAQAPQAPAPAASAAVIVVRPDVAKGINETIDLYKAGKPAEALTRVESAIAAASSPTSGETGMLSRLRGLLLLDLRRPAEAVPLLEGALASRSFQPAEEVALIEALARGNFQAKNYKATLEWLAKASERGSKSPNIYPLRSRSLYLTNDHAGTVREIELHLKTLGNAPAPEEDLRILATSYSQLKDNDGYLRVLERLMREHPRAEYWPDMLARMMRAPTWQERWDLDAYRLRRVVGAMQDAVEYVELAELAAKAGQPIEALAVIEEGFAKGLLGKGPGAAEHQKLRTQTARLADDDRKSLATLRPAAITDARSAGNALSTGAALVAAGQADRGLELMRSALAAPQLAEAAHGRLRHALALHGAGRTAEAVEQLRPLASDDKLGLLARLWALALAPQKKS